MNADISVQLQQQVQCAYETKTALHIIGGNSKAFYGRAISAEKLSVAEHCGVLNYEPTELVITLRAGTLLSEVEKLLDENNQMLAFEPPAYGSNATIGGTIACNLSGPRRAYSGAARDFLLGCKIINGKGEILTFGGEVMKNVAGYDVSRLMANAMGTLGILLEVSLKVLPKPESEMTQLFHCSSAEALKKMHEWSQTPLPVSATSYHDSVLHVRLSGTVKAVSGAVSSVGGDTMSNTDTENTHQYWHDLKEQQLDFFNTEKPVWRLSLASDIESLGFADGSHDEDILYEWGGALRWLKSDTPAKTIQATVAEFDGHATLFRNAHQGIIFQSLPAGLLRIHKNLKQAFDPHNILNPGKLYSEL